MSHDAEAILERLPEEVREALDELKQSTTLEEAGVGTLALFGSVVRGDWAARRSDVNLLVVLADPSEERLAQVVGPPLRDAHRAAGVEPWILRPAELAQVGDAFPVKVLDVSRRHALLRGEGPLAFGELDREHLRIRVEQQLRNALLRLRRRAVVGGDDGGDLLRSLRVATKGLSFELEALLEAAGEPPPGDDRGAILEAAAARFELDREVIRRLLAIRGGPADPDVHGLFGASLEVLEKAVEVADSLEVG